MAAYLDSLLAVLASVDPLWAYSLLVLSAFLENIVPPVPGDTVVVFSAYLVGRGLLDIWPVFFATWVGGTAGFLAMYYLGYSRGRAFFAGRRGTAKLAQAERWLSRYGVALILGNRFLSGIRSVIAIGAGLGRMPWPTVALCSSIGMAIWNGLLLYAGFLVGENWQQVAEVLAQYNRVLVGILCLVGAVLLGRWWRKRRVAPP